MPRNLVFCPIPFTLAEIPLGSLTTDILRPHRNLKIIKNALPEDFATRTHTQYDGVLQKEVAAGFFAQLSRMLHLSRDTSASLSLHVTSTEGREHWLKDPEGFWSDMLTGEKTKKDAVKFLSAVSKQGEGWFVVAVRTFVDANAEVKTGMGFEWKVEAKVPAGEIVKATAGGLPIGDVVGDIGSGVTRTSKTSTHETFSVQGERIFSIEFRKIVLKKNEKGEASGDIPDNSTVVKLLPEFRAGPDFIAGGDGSGGDYLAGFNNESESLKTYDDEFEELAEEGKVRICKEGQDDSVLYVDPQWVQYTDML